MTRLLLTGVIFYLFALSLSVPSESDQPYSEEDTSACPLIDGERACVPVLSSGDSCIPDRGPTDPICPETQICHPEKAVCLGVDFNKSCGSDSGKECGEGLYCGIIYDGWPRDYVCFVEGGEGDVCETYDAYSLSNREPSSWEDPRFRRGCASGLLCFDDGDGRGAVCNADDGREETCQYGGCSREGQGCLELDEQRKVCTNVVPIGEACEPGVSRCARSKLSTRSGMCVKDGGSGGGAFKCLLIKTLGETCDSGQGACRNRENDGSTVNNLRCDAGYCAEDKEEGGLLQLCSNSTNCAQSPDSGTSRICAVAQDGQRRCLYGRNYAGQSWITGCAYSDEWIKVRQLPMDTCTIGSSCQIDFFSAQRGIGRSSCINRELTRKATEVGEPCNNVTLCAEKDSEGRSVSCVRNPSGGEYICISRLKDGESCALKNTICGPTEGRQASCDGENICRVTDDETCMTNEDCEAGSGKTCVPGNLSYSFAKFCYNYEKQLGETCPQGNTRDEACADGLMCSQTAESDPSKRTGRCVRLAADGEKCNMDEFVQCSGSVFSPRSICLNGTCRALIDLGLAIY